MQIFAPVFTALALIGSAAAQTTIHPPGGSAIITVQLDGTTYPTGCLDVNGLWTITGACATYNADGVGDISGPNGQCQLNSVSTLHCVTPDTAAQPTAWVGDFLNGNKSAMYLVANSGATKPPFGGPIFYSYGKPSSVKGQGSPSVLISGNSTATANTGGSKVYISWIVKS